MSRLSWDGISIPDVHLQLEQSKLELKRAKQFSHFTILVTLSIGIVVGILLMKFNLI